jgi:hypothetical protein
MLPAPRKVTQLERAMNRVVMAVLVGLAALALLLGVNSMVWEVRHNPYDRDWYLGMQVRTRGVCVGGGGRGEGGTCGGGGVGGLEGDGGEAE